MEDGEQAKLGRVVACYAAVSTPIDFTAYHRVYDQSLAMWRCGEVTHELCVYTLIRYSMHWLDCDSQGQCFVVVMIC